MRPQDLVEALFGLETEIGRMLGVELCRPTGNDALDHRIRLAADERNRLVATDTAKTDRQWSWVEGTAGGEPLHFEAQGVGRFVTLAGIPVEGPDSFPVTLLISYGDGSQDTAAASVFVRQPDYTMEKLRVPPAMAKPDLLLGVDGSPVSNVGDLQRLMTGDRIGKQVGVEVFRGGRVQTVAVVPVELPD